MELLREALTSFARRYGVPVMVTETCVTGSVAERLSWLDDSIALVEAPEGLLRVANPVADRFRDHATRERGAQP